MSFEKIPEQNDKEKPADYRGICPNCHDHLTFYHDLQCPMCDRQRVLWCPTCQAHYLFKV